MRKVLQNKINKFYCKCFTLQQEFEQLQAEIQTEADAAEQKFNELEKKYNETNEPNDCLQERYDKAEELIDEMQDLLFALDDVMIADALISLGPFTSDLPDELTVKLKEKPSFPKEFIISVEHKEFIPSTGQFFLTLAMRTDINPRPISHVVYWNEETQSWKHDGKSASLPWLGGGQLYKKYITKKDELFTQLYNATENLHATFSLKDE